MLFSDVAGFGDPRRDDDDRRVVRDVVYRILQESFAASGVSWEHCLHEDRGDGILTVAPATVPTGSLVDPLLLVLAAKLRRHNRQAAEPVRIRLRLALHVGPVTPDRHGVWGSALIHAARLLDAPVLRESLAATGADLAFIASGHVYDTVVRHGTGLVDPACFQPVPVRVKETDTTGWMYLGGARTAARTPVLAFPDGEHP